VLWPPVCQPFIYQDAFGLNEIASYKVVFAGFAFFQVGVALMYLWMPPAVEVLDKKRQWGGNLLKLSSRGFIFTLTALSLIIGDVTLCAVNLACMRLKEGQHGNGHARILS